MSHISDTMRNIEGIIQRYYERHPEELERVRAVKGLQLKKAPASTYKFHPPEDKPNVLADLAAGLRPIEISKKRGIAYFTVAKWSSAAGYVFLPRKKKGGLTPSE